MGERVGPALYGRDLYSAGVEPDRGTLGDRFTLPPFSVLNAREGWWQTRKALWIGLGIASEIGRGGNLLELSEGSEEEYRRGEGDYAKRARAAAPGGGGNPRSSAYFAVGAPPRPDSIQGREKKQESTASLKGGLTFGLTMDPYKEQRKAKKPGSKRRTEGPSQPGLVHHLTCGAYTNRGKEAAAADCGTSIFDPVLCELLYRWFSPVGGQIVDPFAGGSVRGIVAGKLGRRYWGCDLSSEQIAANRQQGRDVLGQGAVRVRISAASLRQRFNGCDPDYIRDVCHASCCRSSSAPGGALVTVHRTEVLKIRDRGAEVRDGLIVPRDGRCPFQSKKTDLCDLHGTGDKPFGCVASPFTLNSNSTLIVRNRYRTLKCYDDGRKLPAYVAFRASLVLLFGEAGADNLAEHLDNGGGDLDVFMDRERAEMLWDNDATKRGEERERERGNGDLVEWVNGDSAVELANAPAADAILSCHPDTVKVLTVDRGSLPIADVRVGEEVITHTGHKRKVTERISLRFTGDMYSFLRDYRSYPLVATSDHPILIRRLTKPGPGECKCGCGGVTAPDTNYLLGHNNKNHNGRWGNATEYGSSTRTRLKQRTLSEIKWVRANEVRIGDYFVEPVPPTPTNPLDGTILWTAPLRNGRGRGNREVRATAELCRLLGYYLAEGWGHERGVCFAFHEKETEYHEDIRSIWGSIFSPDLKVTVRPVENSRAVSVICNGTIAGDFFLSNQACGTGAANKRLPRWIWNCSDSLLAELVKGAWRGDGWTSGKRLGYASVSENLVEDLRRVLLRLGVLCSVRVRPPRTGYGKSRKPQWYLAVRGESAAKLAAILGEEIEQPEWRRRRGPFIEGGLAYYPVRKISVERVRKHPVYNLEVEEDHSYLADGVSSHNCPPYGDLEQYSKNPADLSNMSWDDFRAAYWEIIQKSCDRLKDNRFACFVVGDFRGPDGCYRNFPGDTIRAFQKAGLKLYNEAILVTAVGSLSIRTERQFYMSGKMGRTHQNVLVFVKGDPKRAMDAVTGESEEERRNVLKKRAEERKKATVPDWGGDPEEDG